MTAARAPLAGQSSTSCFLRLCRLSVFSTLSLSADALRPLLFSLFVSRNVKASDLPEDRKAFEMDCVSLAIGSLNMVALAGALGLNGSVYSYAPLAFGAGNSVELHLVLYRQLLLLAAMTLVLVVVLFNAEPLLLLAAVPPAMTSQTVKVLHLMAWSVPGNIVYDCLGRWASSQQRQHLVAICGVAGLCVSLLLNLLLADPAAPFSAPIVALVTQNTLLPVFLAAGLFSARKPVCAPLSAVLAGLPAQFGNAVVQMFWTCAEMWGWEVQVFEARALAMGDLASYALLSSTYSTLIMIPGGACLGLTALVGEAIGLGLPERARELLGMGCFYSVTVVIMYALPLSLLRHRYAHLVSGGVPAVESKVAAVLPVILTLQVFDGLFNILKSWLTVRRHQVFGAAQSILAYYAVGVPFGWWLAFPQGWSIVGLWVGLGAAVALGSVTCGVRVAVDVQELCAGKGKAALGLPFLCTDTF